MIETAFHQLRFVLSLAFGLPFSPGSLEHLVAAMRETVEEFGTIGSDGLELVNGLALDAETQREVIERRFRSQAKRAARETPYYRDLFKTLDLDPAKLTYADIARVPLTPKQAIRDYPDSFVSEKSRPYLRATTTGTTGKPTSIHFSEREMRVYFALTALSLIANKTLTSEDILQISVSSRGLLGNVVTAVGAGHVGAMVYQTGVIEPEHALKMLTEQRQVTGKKPRTTDLYTYPTYLGYMVEYGLAHGYQPSDFGLERISSGGEMVTAGLKNRAERLFGPVRWLESYGITELWPLGATLNTQGLLEFEISHGLVEILNPDTGKPAQPGEIGTLVGTPFPPFRETTLLLRYDTQDMVRLPEKPMPKLMTSNVLGKKSLCIRHTDGWTTPRDVVEALESLDVVSLPAGFGFYPCGDGVGVEVVADTRSRAQIGDALEAAAVPLRELHLYDSADALQHPYPLRGNLREIMFDDPIRKQVAL
jgi:phenylacetate-CoA ligase